MSLCIYIKNYKGNLNKQKQLLNLYYNNNKLSKIDKGWIKQEINSIENKSKNKHNRIKKRIVNPPGYDLAHERGREKIKGFGYEHTNLILKQDHKNQHKYDNFGKYNRTRCFEKFYISQ